MDPAPYEYILIKHRQSGLYLDLEGANKSARTKVLLWRKNGNDNQVWYLDPTTWTYRSKLHDMCLTIDPERQHLVCDDVRAYDASQQWQMSAMHIKNAQNNYLVLECAPGAKEGSIITSANYNGQENQFWDVERTGGHAPPKLSNCPPMNVNPTPGAPPANTGQPQYPGYAPSGVQICPMPPNMGDANFNAGFGGPQVGQAGLAPSGASLNVSIGGNTTQTGGMELPQVGASVSRQYFMIVTEINGKAIDIRRGDKTAGAKIIMYKPHKEKNQHWYTDEKGFIRAAINDMVFHANEAGHSLTMVPYIEDPRHQWKLDGNKIVNGKGQCLDIRGGGSSDGSELCAYQYKNAPNQHWKFLYV